MATLWIAATIGFGLASSAAISESRFGSAIAFGEPNSRMSAPPENALPAPVTTIALTVGVGERLVEAVDDAATRVVAEAVDRRVVHRDDGDVAAQLVVRAHDRSSWKRPPPAGRDKKNVRSILGVRPAAKLAAIEELARPAEVPAPDTELRGNRLRVSILGAGAVAYGAAAFLARAGHDPLLWSPSGTRTAALAAGKPLVATNAIEGTFAVRVAASCADAVADADVVMLALPGQRPQARARRGGAAPPRRASRSSSARTLSFGALYLSRLLAARGSARADRRLGNDADDRTPGEPDRGQRRDGAPARRHGDRPGERRRRRPRPLQRALRRPLRQARRPPRDRPQQPQSAEPSRHRPAQPDAHGARRDLGPGRERHAGRRPADRGARPRAPRHRRGVRPARQDRAGALLAVVPRAARRASPR